MKFPKKAVSLICAFSMFSGITAFALENEDTELPSSGIGHIQAVELTRAETEAAKNAVNELYEHYACTPMEISENEDLFSYDYTEDYIYKQLNDEDKAIYDNMYRLCHDFAVSDIDVTETDGYYYIGGLSISSGYYYGGENGEHFLDVADQFLYANPQFYFFRSLIGFGEEVNGSIDVFFCCGEIFADHADRQAWTEKLHSKTLKWLGEINSCGNDFEKVQKIYTLICDNTSYGYDTDAGHFYDQTITGCLGVGKCVCAGYTKTFNYFCHLAGIDSIGVLSRSHAWNIVDIFGYWYIIDITNLDQGNRMKYCLKSEKFCEENFGYGRGMFLPFESMYGEKGFLVLPECVKDEVEVPPFIDINGDGKCDKNDVDVMFNALTADTEISGGVYDADNDGNFDIRDLSLICYSAAAYGK